uniref:FGFR1 oncogene partner n=1 Tax=Ciona intestinalis TaxID=7719 RepID=UPI000180CEE1|nr:FGFR1 oncogene partner [Ciona intestinalis]|eukprot:XP_002125932.1 FGFR1 oncogene partner [Ciona intestinalis]
MSAADDDTELRDLLVQTLDKNGVLGKIKAELRASVFLALDSSEQNKYKSGLANTKLQNFLATEDGKICLNVVKDFLEHFNLDYTSSVLGPETNSTNTSFSTEELQRTLHQPNDCSPVLSSLVQNSRNNSPSELQLNLAKEEFSRQAMSMTDSISTFSATKALTSLLPNFPSAVLKSFFQSEVAAGAKVSCAEFLRIYTKFFTACHSVVATPNTGDTTVKDEKDFIKQAVGIRSGGGKLTPEPIDSDYLKPSQKSFDLDSSYGQFFDDDIYTKPPQKLQSLSESSKKSKSEVDTSLSKSDHSFGWRGKSPTKTNFEKQSDDYEDDFTTSHASISEDIAVDSFMSSNHSSLAELTEDHSMQDQIHSADYMEDIKSA